MNAINYGQGYPPPPPSPPQPRISNIRFNMWVAIAITFGFFAVIALFVMLRSGETVSECMSSVGVTAQAFSPSENNQCNSVETIHTIAEMFTVLLSIGCGVSIWKARKS